MGVGVVAIGHLYTERVAGSTRVRPVLAGRLSDFVYRYRFVLFAAWLIHVFYFHYFILGFMSWDGFGHRGVPIVELYQHGSMGKWKYNEWSLTGYTPLVELAHIPFLYVFKMRGFIIGFPLFVLPLCVIAVYKLVGELTGNKRAATWGALAYVAIPMINQQPFSNYIDFAVSGILAYWLYAMLRLRSDERAIVRYVRLAVATVLFSLARSQGPYVLVVLFPLIAYAVFCERERFKLRVRDWRGLLTATAVMAVALAPSVALQIWKYLEYGSPIAPMELKFLGVTIGKGFPMDTYFKYAGLGGGDIGSLAKGFFDGWVWHSGWPVGAFYASRFMAAGLLFLLAVVMLPYFLRKATRLELAVLAAGVFVSLLTKDFGVPRWGYTTVIAIAIIIGRTMGELSESRRGRPAFWAAALVLFVHLLRPEFDYLQYRTRQSISARMNIVASKHFLNGVFDVEPFPDRNFKLVIVENPGNNFALHLFGRKLTNEVVGTLRGGYVGPRCEGVLPFLIIEPNAVFVDDDDWTKNCQRECAIKAWVCRAWKITPP